MDEFTGFSTEKGLPTGDQRKPIKICTVVRVEQLTVDGSTLSFIKEIVDWSIVDHDHKFGFYDDGTLHIEGRLEVKYTD